MSDFRLFTKTDVVPAVKPFDWDVVINNRPYSVAQFEGFVHTIGGKRGVNDLWAWPRAEVPTYENLVAFDGPGGALWGIIYKPSRYIKCKWDEYYVRNAESVTITRNGEPFYEICAGLNYGIDKARTLIARINEHPLKLNTIDYDQKMIGRKVWRRSEPAVITRWVGNGQACVVLEPDGIERFTVPPEFADEDAEYYEDRTVKTSIFDEHIWWFRD